MSDLPTWPDLFSATSSPASASGPSPCDRPDGATISRSGPAPAHVNLSARQAKAAGLLTSGTCGPPSTGSSSSAVLNSSLASRLHRKTALLGSTLYRLTWKRRATPSGRSIPALRASALRTSGSGSTGWPTPNVADDNNSRWQDPQKSSAARMEKSSYSNLAITAQVMAAWPTPTTRDWKDGSPNENVPVNALLGREVWCAGWPTPMAGTPAQKGYNEAGNNDSSRKTVALAGWQTPTEIDSRRGDYQYDQGDKSKPRPSNGGMAKMCGPARLTASGEMLTGSAARMESGGQLHPEHSLWLQVGPFATAWANCAARVTRSTSRKRLASSKR